MLHIDDQTYKSPNFDTRHLPISMIVIHSTADDNADGTTSYLCNSAPINSATGKADPKLAVSSHYVIWKDGRVFQLVSDAYRAWHAGESKWSAITDCNSASLGVEMVNDNSGHDAYPPAQVSALVDLVEWKMRQYSITAENVVRHLDIAPRRKTDPAGFDFEGFKKSLTFAPAEMNAWFKWGIVFPIYDDTKHFGIPQTWLANVDKLGEARSFEMFGDDGSVQAFQHGYVGYSKATNKTRVVLFASVE